LFRAAFPGELARVVGQLPVLRLVVQESSPRLGASITPSAYEVHPGAEPTASGQPRWAWDTTFLGSLTALLRKEVVGVTPDGLRINWHVTTGSFVGPGIDAIVLPGAADWMRIRRDGVAIVSVQACFETHEGARVYGSYGGIFDLGPDGYARALRDEYDHLPPVVVTPTYATADPPLEWLNRAQCIGVGRVDMTALRVEFDVYVVRVGDRIRRASHDGNTMARSAASTPASLYTRLGGRDVVVGVTEDFVAWILADRQLGRFFPNAHDQTGLKELKERVVELLCEISGGPCVYKGRDMKTAHKGLGITDADWKIAVDLFTAALEKRHVPPEAQSEFVQIIENMKSQIVEVPRRP
jgi:truncated hemoglobin YjbI